MIKVQLIRVDTMTSATETRAYVTITGDRAILALMDKNDKLRSQAWKEVIGQVAEIVGSYDLEWQGHHKGFLVLGSTTYPRTTLYLDVTDEVPS